MTGSWARAHARTAVSAEVATAIVVVVFVAAFAGYLFVSSSPAKTSSSQTSSTASSSSGGSYPFSFNLLNARAAIVGQNDYTQIVVLQIIHPLEGSNETVDLAGQGPAGVTVAFTPASPVVLTPVSTVLNVSVVVTTAAAAPGNYTVTVSGYSRTSSQTTSFTLEVVKYRVAIFQHLFEPRVLNVTAGSTVYWQNLDGPEAYCGTPLLGNGQHNLVFTTLQGADSPTIKQFQVYNFTFNTPGSYYYYSSIDPDDSVNGTINVLKPSSGGMGDVSPLPTFSYFKPSSQVTTPVGGARDAAPADFPTPRVSATEALSLAGLAFLGGLVVFAAREARPPGWGRVKARSENPRG
jgi:plastocyanin